MPFGRLDDKANGNAKLLALTDSAWRMWGCGLIYCQDNLTDGYIPTHAIHAFGVRAKNKDAIAAELCRVMVPNKGPLWHVVKGGFQIHDYLDWNDSKEEILKARAGAKDRIARFRERDRLEREALQQRVRDAEQNADPDGARNALQDGEHLGEQHAHDVVRGSGDLKEERTVARFPAAHPGAGVLAGALPREHLKHAACDPTYSLCVPQAVHAKLLSKLAPKHGGDRDAASDALKAWYPVVWATLPSGFVMGEEFKFWQGQFDAVYASPNAASTARPHEPKSTVPSADRTAEYLRRQRQG